MDRRRFLSLFGLGVAGIALEQAVPLGRVWSFPSEIVIPELSSAQSIALQLEKVREMIPTLYESDHALHSALYYDLNREALSGTFFGIARAERYPLYTTFPCGRTPTRPSNTTSVRLT
jgi:hypothetical protein